MFYLMSINLFTYGKIVWGQAAQTNLNKILLLQKRVLCLIYFAPYKSHAIPGLFNTSNILPSITLKTISLMTHDVFNSF